MNTNPLFTRKKNLKQFLRLKGALPFLLDSGVPGGADERNPLASGARAVCLGRPYAYGMLIAIAAGIYEVLKNPMPDFKLTRRLARGKNVNEVKKTEL